VELCYNPPRFDGPRARFLFVGADFMDVAGLVEKTLAGLGYELVDLELSGRGLMRIFIDKPLSDANYSGITLDDCERVSHQLTRLFTVEGVDFDRLEVSSPGLDRPLKKEADFVRFRGQKVQVKLRVPMEGRKNFVGVIGELQAGKLQLELEGSSVLLELSNLDKARLVPVF
jgi:ribosome maturation factor RimP